MKTLCSPLMRKNGPFAILESQNEPMTFFRRQPQRNVGPMQIVFMIPSPFDSFPSKQIHKFWKMKRVNFRDDYYFREKACFFSTVTKTLCEHALCDFRQKTL